MRADADRLLVTRYLGGDESAFADIANFYRAKIFSLVLNFLHDHGDTEEIVQDTFLRAHRNLARFRGDSSLATWLYRIATNLARNRYWYFHRRSRHTTVSLNTPISAPDGATIADLISSSTPDPGHENSQKDFTEVLTSCLTKLEGHHREILSQRVIENRSYDEISGSLGLKPGTVKSRIARARECLRRQLIDTCPEFATAGDAAQWFKPYRATSAIGAL